MPYFDKVVESILEFGNILEKTPAIIQKQGLLLPTTIYFVKNKVY